MSKKNKKPLHTETETSDQYSEIEQKDSLLRKRGPSVSLQEPFKTIDEKNEKEDKPQSTSPVIERTVWTIILLLGFFMILGLGHAYCLLLILSISFQMYREIISLRRKAQKDNQVPMSSYLNWYFFIIGVCFFYGKLINSKLSSVVMAHDLLKNTLKYLNLVTFMLWIFGFLCFILSLRRHFYLYQFTQFGFSHITLFLIVGQITVIGMNLYEGLIWFIFPCLLVIVNDIFAYIWGKWLGRTRLIELSPKKTWEGFIGGALTTLLFGVIAAYYFQQYQQFICPQLTEFQLHSLALSVFASVIAPFGGFFASGFKRAIKVKDFADIIPGHGGLTDRMDCQILMGMFSYLYLHQVILSHTSNDYLLNYVHQLTTDEQLALLAELQYIITQKQIPTNHSI